MPISSLGLDHAAFLNYSEFPNSCLADQFLLLVIVMRAGYSWQNWVINLISSLFYKQQVPHPDIAARPDRKCAGSFLSSTVSRPEL